MNHLYFISDRVSTVTTGNPCKPSPCGPNSKCHPVNGIAACFCLPNFYGSPPSCRPECLINTDCKFNLICNNFKCVDPCPGTCGLFAVCKTVNHHPICFCLQSFTGNPYMSCRRIIGLKNKFIQKQKTENFFNIVFS